MGVATCQVQCLTGASPTYPYNNAEGGIKFSREDSVSGGTLIPIPTSTGTNFSWIKNLVLAVTATGTTSINNRKIAQSAGAATGLNLYWKAIAVASYAQASAANQPVASNSNGAVPAGYTLLSTSAAVYDNTSVATSSTGANGAMTVCVLGCDNLYVGGSGNAVALPNLLFSFDEA